MKKRGLNENEASVTDSYKKARMDNVEDMEIEDGGDAKGDPL